MIPGMAARNKSNEVIVPFLGFDGDRLNNILEGMDYDEVCPSISQKQGMLFSIVPAPL